MPERNDNDPPRNRSWDRDGRDDDDDRSRRRRDREDDDYDDDRPRRRRDEDDYDDRPRRRRDRDDDRGTGKSSSVVMILVIVGAVCMGCLIVGGILVALLLPAVQKVRGAAARVNDSNNLKQLSLGTMNYADANNTLPPADGDLSWRYHILPHIEQEGLFRQMNPREPWDGPTNKKFASTKVKPFMSANEPDSPDTRYRVFVGPDTLYVPGKKPLSVPEITDGISNTIMIVEAGERVPWPQPRELPYDRNGSLPKLGGPHPGGFLVAMVDGSVRFVSEKTSPEVIRAGIEPKDGRGFDPEP